MLGVGDLTQRIDGKEHGYWFEEGRCIAGIVCRDLKN